MAGVAGSRQYIAVQDCCGCVLEHYGMLISVRLSSRQNCSGSCTTWWLLGWKKSCKEPSSGRSRRKSGSCSNDGRTVARERVAAQQRFDGLMPKKRPFLGLNRGQISAGPLPQFYRHHSSELLAETDRSRNVPKLVNQPPRGRNETARQSNRGSGHAHCRDRLGGMHHFSYRNVT